MALSRHRAVLHLGTRRVLRRRTGFTIPSMLVAIILLAVGLVSLATASANTITLQTQAQHRTNAIAVGRSYLELVHTRDLWSVASESPVRVNADGASDPNGAFERSMDVTVIRDNLLRVVLTVTYPRATQPVTITTSFFRGTNLAGP